MFCKGSPGGYEGAHAYRGAFMDRLILFRHGKARTESDSGDDFDRKLADRGRRESADTARKLGDMGLIPDFVLVSSAARTRETWECAAPHFPAARASFEDALYHAASGDIRRCAEGAGEAGGAVMVVGHNPGLQELTLGLLIEGSAPASLIERVQRQFPTATAAVFLFDHAGKPAYDGLFFPERGY